MFNLNKKIVFIKSYFCLFNLNIKILQYVIQQLIHIKTEATILFHIKAEIFIYYLDILNL